MGQRHRQQKDFASDDVARLELLTPHLVRALQLRRLQARVDGLGSAAATFDQLEDAMIIVDAKSRVITTNVEADELLRLNDPLRVRLTGQLATSNSETTTMLHRHVSQASGLPIPNGLENEPGQTLALTRRDGSSLVVSVKRIGGANNRLFPAPERSAIIIIRDPQRQPSAPPAELLRQLYGLSKTEAAIAINLSVGKAIEEIAAIQGIRISTLRWHLKAIFAKTGASRQAELVRLVARIS